MFEVRDIIDKNSQIKVPLWLFIASYFIFILALIPEKILNI